MKNKTKGDLGEEAAVKYLKKQKYKIIARNYRAVTGEIDIIALDGKTLVFAEVKTRSSGKFGAPSLAVTGEKRLKIAKTAQSFISQNEIFSLEKRFDVIEVTEEGVNHITGAFETDLL